ncbi:hypothetical protein NLJ89_g11 [Agrocybe chaxingu]|uniref:Uncharacterized protein n=1 Tax=Agrocybe chaxingu TaxID=84603 RepID=A0A9W8TGG6_9AGAR|nr:hypothetical protein NLJ89_g11 [Agrocybe chaxingu]
MPRSYQDHSMYRGRSPSTAPVYGYSRASGSRSELPRNAYSDASHEGDSTSNPSPTSPTTPNSLSESEHTRYTGAGVVRGKPFPSFTVDRLSQEHAPAHAIPDTHSLSASDTITVRRNSYDVQSDTDSHQPHRPW